MVIKCGNGRSNVIIVSNSREHDFHSRKCSFHSSFDSSGVAKSTPQHEKQIAIIRLPPSGTFGRMEILRKPLAFISKTLNQDVKIFLRLTKKLVMLRSLSRHFLVASQVAIIAM